MPVSEIQRAYNMTNSDLCMFVSNLVNYMTRDETEFTAFSVLAADTLAFKALGDDFENLPTDEELVADISYATENKNAKANELKIGIRAIAVRVENKWGVNSALYRKFGVTGMNKFNDRDLLTCGKKVHRNGTAYLAQLAGEGLTAGILTDFLALVNEFEQTLNDLDEAVAERDIKAEERMLKGNELYALTVKYCNIGKQIWADVSPAKYNDYVIYATASPGTLAAPQNLVFNYGSKVLWWDAVDNAVSYQLQWFDGSDFIEIYTGSDINFSYTPPDGLNKFRVRAHNAGGYGPWSEILEQYYFAVLPKAANLQVVQSGTIPTEGELTWDAVPTAFNYKVYQSVDNIGEYAAHWLVIGTVTEPLKSVTLTLGKRNSFRVETNNTYQTSMSDPVYIEV